MVRDALHTVVRYYHAFGLLEPSGRLQFSHVNYAATEDWGTVTVTIRRAFGTNGAISAQISTIDETARVNEDYEKINAEKISWADGEFDEKYVVVQFIDDQVYENHDETFGVYLHDPIGTTIYEPYHRATVTIKGLSDPVHGELGFKTTTVSVAEDIDTGIIHVPVARMTGTDGAVSVAYTVDADTATENVDYQVDESLILSWENGDNTDKYISITIINDAVFEANEHMVITLHSPSNATLGTIRDVVLSISGPNDGKY